LAGILGYGVGVSITIISTTITMAQPMSTMIHIGAFLVTMPTMGMYPITAAPTRIVPGLQDILLVDILHHIEIDTHAIHAIHTNPDLIIGNDILTNEDIVKAKKVTGSKGMGSKGTVTLAMVRGPMGMLTSMARRENLTPALLHIAGDVQSLPAQ
jgi:hypothetical protein